MPKVKKEAVAGTSSSTDTDAALSTQTTTRESKTINNNIKRECTQGARSSDEGCRKRMKRPGTMTATTASKLTTIPIIPATVPATTVNADTEPEAESSKDMAAIEEQPQSSQSQTMQDVEREEIQPGNEDVEEIQEEIQVEQLQPQSQTMQDVKGEENQLGNEDADNLQKEFAFCCQVCRYGMI
jgi:hypothetical protein